MLSISLWSCSLPRCSLFLSDRVLSRDALYFSLIVFSRATTVSYGMLNLYEAFQKKLCLDSSIYEEKTWALIGDLQHQGLMSIFMCTLLAPKFQFLSVLLFHFINGQLSFTIYQYLYIDISKQNQQTISCCLATKTQRAIMSSCIQNTDLFIHMLIVWYYWGDLRRLLCVLVLFLVFVHCMCIYLIA